MTRAQASKIIRRLLGPTAAIDVGAALSSPERRDWARVLHQANTDERARVQAEIDRLVREFYQTEPIATLRAERDRLNKAERTLPSPSYHKFEAFTKGGIAGFPIWTVEASGDTWEEVIEKLRAKKGAR